METQKELESILKELQKCINVIEDSDLEHYIYCDALRELNFQFSKHQKQLNNLRNEKSNR